MFHSALNFKVAVAQMHTAPGDVRRNLAHMLACIADARAQGVVLVVFPELATSGYLLGDRWEYDEFINEIVQANETICSASQGITIVWGSVRADRARIGEDGRVRKYNAALVAQNGQWMSNGILHGWIPKTNLPKYRIFDDARHFYPAGKLAQEMKNRIDHLWQLLRPFEVTIGGRKVRLGLTVCEDLWEDEYFEKPSRIYGMHDVDLLIDISQSPWTNEKWHARDGMLTRRAHDVNAPILYVNSVGLQNNAKNLVWFDGNSAFIDAEGQFRWRAPQHESGLHILDLKALPDAMSVREHVSGIEEIYDAGIHAMHEFFAPFKRIVVGLSGGVDSAVMLAWLVDAIGPERLLAVNMPTPFNSATTRNLAFQCAKNLGVQYLVSPIQDVYESEVAAHRELGYEPSTFVRENIQARARGHRLAGIAAEEGSVFTNNGNKTEVALNYFTLYGDGAGVASFLGDLWKGQVYELGHFINAQHGKELIPQGIFDVVPSAELSADQNVDEGKGDPIFYPYHDKLLRVFTERRRGPVEVLESALKGALESDIGCEPGTIAKYFSTRRTFVDNLEWAWRQYNGEFKRVQLPPVFITSRRAFGFDRRDTIAPAYLTEEYCRLREQYLREAV